MGPDSSTDCIYIFIPEVRTRPDHIRVLAPPTVPKHNSVACCVLLTKRQHNINSLSNISIIASRANRAASANPTAVAEASALSSCQLPLLGLLSVVILYPGASTAVDGGMHPQHFGRGDAMPLIPLAATNLIVSIITCHIQLSVDCHSSCMNGDIWR